MRASDRAWFKHCFFHSPSIWETRVHKIHMSWPNLERRGQLMCIHMSFIEIFMCIWQLMCISKYTWIIWNSHVYCHGFHRFMCNLLYCSRYLYLFFIFVIFSFHYSLFKNGLENELNFSKRGLIKYIVFTTYKYL